MTQLCCNERCVNFRVSCNLQQEEENNVLKMHYSRG